MTDRFILIGHPVSHSLSPVIHGAAYRSLGCQATYDLVDCVDEAAVRTQVDRLRKGEIRGANVTVPWKKVAFDAADQRHKTALDVGVANVLARSDDGAVVAYNTDASALAVELVAAVTEAQVDREQRPDALVLGSGGAALGAVVACKMSGARRVAVTARRFDPLVESSQWPEAAEWARLDAMTLPWPGLSAGPVRGYLEGAHLIVQATSAGMKGKDGGEELAQVLPLALVPRLVAYDLVYIPRETPFLRQAKGAGHFAKSGLGMLVGQAAEAIEIWLSKRPPRDEMRLAAEEALGL